MIKKPISSWVLGGVLGATALWLRPVSATEHTLFVQGTTDNFNCLAPSGSGNNYYAEAWGYDAAGTKQCELSQLIASAYQSGLALCAPVGGIFVQVPKIKAVVTLRNYNTRQWIATKAQDSAPKDWATGSSARYVEPAHGSCPASVVDSVVRGYDN